MCTSFKEWKEFKLHFSEATDAKVIQIRNWEYEKESESEVSLFRGRVCASQTSKLVSEAAAQRLRLFKHLKHKEKKGLLLIFWIYWERKNHFAFKSPIASCVCTKVAAVTDWNSLTQFGGIEIYPEARFVRILEQLHLPWHQDSDKRKYIFRNFQWIFSTLCCVWLLFLQCQPCHENFCICHLLFVHQSQ